MKIWKQNQKIVAKPATANYKKDHESIIKIKQKYYKSIINLLEVENIKKNNYANIRDKNMTGEKRERKK